MQQSSSKGKPCARTEDIVLDFSQPVLVNRTIAHLDYRVSAAEKTRIFTRVKIGYFLRVEVSVYNSACFIYIVRSKNLDFFCANMFENMKYISRVEQGIPRSFASFTLEIFCLTLEIANSNIFA